MSVAELSNWQFNKAFLRRQCLHIVYRFSFPGDNFATLIQHLNQYKSVVLDSEYNIDLRLAHKIRLYIVEHS